MNGRALILVRHAMPEVMRGVPSTEWRLGEAAKEDCVLLAHALPRELAPLVYTSSEPKARETGAIIALRRGLQVVVDERLGEVRRPEVWHEDYRELAARYLEGEDHAGWEPRDEVVARFAAGVEAAMAQPGKGDVVVANHGMALSLYLGSVGAVDVAPFWRALGLPDAWRWEAGVLARVAGLRTED